MRIRRGVLMTHLLSLSQMASGHVRTRTTIRGSQAGPDNCLFDQYGAGLCLLQLVATQILRSAA